MARTHTHASTHAAFIRAERASMCRQSDLDHDLADEAEIEAEHNGGLEDMAPPDDKSSRSSSRSSSPPIDSEADEPGAM